MNTHLTDDLDAAAQRIARARHWPDFVAAVYAGFEPATRTARALVDASPIEEHVRLAEAERAATDGRDILRAAPGCMNAAGPLGPPITVPADRVAVTEAGLSRLAGAVADRFALALDDPLSAAELVAFSQAMDAADRLLHALDPGPFSPSPLRQDARRTDSAVEVDDGNLP